MGRDRAPWYPINEMILGNTFSISILLTPKLWIIPSLQPEQPAWVLHIQTGEWSVSW